MEERRGKRKKRWQLALGLKEVIFAGLGVAGLMMMSFALGTLAGRGDIYRVLYNWGLLPPEASKVAQTWQPPVASLPAQSAAATAAPATGAVSGNAGTPGAAPEVAAAAPPSSVPAPGPGAAAVQPAPAPVTGAIAGLPGSPAPAKKSKGAPSHKELKSKEEEMRRMRREVVAKLKFQNSFDTSPVKPAKAKEKEKAKEKAAPKQTQVQIAQFRDGNAARAKLAELQKKGEKVTLKQGKDQKGTYYVISRQAPAASGEAKSPAHNQKSVESKSPNQH